MTRLDGIDVSQMPIRIADKIVIADNGCWVWIGAKQPMGYGNTWFAGQSWSAHRLVYTLLVGELESGALLHHECERPSCCNPEHLIPMTRCQHAAQHGLAGMAQIHADASTCAKGHPFDHHDGRQRVCRECARTRGREWARQKRMAA